MSESFQVKAKALELAILANQGRAVLPIENLISNAQVFEKYLTGMRVM